MPEPTPPAVPAPPRLPPHGRAARTFQARDLLALAVFGAVLFQSGWLGEGVAAQGPAARLQPGAAVAPQGAGAGPASPAAPPPLVTEVAEPGYAPGSAERAVFDALNDARAKGNFGLLAQDSRLDAAAAAHAGYMALNLRGEIAHAQEPGRPGFTGETPQARIRAAGYETSRDFEAISSGTSARACLELLNTVYHLGSLMIGAADVGIAVHPEAGCVIEPQLPQHSERMQARRAGSIGAYPYPGQQGVPAAFMPATEVPNPAPDLGNALVGPPVLVDLNSALAASRVVLARFTLAEAGSGRAVEARVLGGRSVSAAPAAALDLKLDRRIASAGHVFLLPLRPLAPATTYAVDFAASVDGAAVSRHWEFTTR